MAKKVVVAFGSAVASIWLVGLGVRLGAFDFGAGFRFEGKLKQIFGKLMERLRLPGSMGYSCQGYVVSKNCLHGLCISLKV